MSIHCNGMCSAQESWMKRAVPVFLFLFALPLAIPAQQVTPASPAPLNDTQVLGRRLFQQRCAVCHTESTPGARKYGPDLYKELVIGNEDTIRGFIANGVKQRMPGFRYGLEPAEIDAIIEYLKIRPRPAKQNAVAPQTGGMD